MTRDTLVPITNRSNKRVITSPADHRSVEQPEYSTESKPVSRELDNSIEKYRHELVTRRGYHRSTTFAEAIRLIGAAGEAYTAHDVRVTPIEAPYDKPEGMWSIWDSALRKLKQEAQARGASFHNSLHTRLVKHHIHTIPNIERKQLELTLAPLWWEEYAVARRLTDQMTIDDLGQYVDLDLVAETGTISSNRLHNILDTATTLATIDGYLLYSRRGKQVSVVEDRFTSCVAENISAQKDSSLDRKMNDALPAPFRAALRGTAEELSKDIAEYLQDDEGCKLACLGLSFDLLGYHPDMLFFGILPITFEEFQRICRENPGEDFFEGQAQGVHLSALQKGEYGHMLLPNWTGGGKAAFMRAIEFLKYWAEVAGCDWANVVPRLKLTSTEYGLI